MTKTTPFDPADYLTSPEAIAEFLADALTDSDLDYITHALMVAARALARRERHY